MASASIVGGYCEPICNLWATHIFSMVSMGGKTGRPCPFPELVARQEYSTDSRAQSHIPDMTFSAVVSGHGPGAVWAMVHHASPTGLHIIFSPPLIHPLINGLHNDGKIPHLYPFVMGRLTISHVQQLGNKFYQKAYRSIRYLACHLAESAFSSSHRESDLVESDVCPNLAMERLNPGPKNGEIHDSSVVKLQQAKDFQHSYVVQSSPKNRIAQKNPTIQHCRKEGE